MDRRDGGPGTAIEQKAARLLTALAGAFILVMMVLTGVDVAGRYLFAAPVSGVFEITEFALGLSAFAALPVVALRRGHISADLLTGFMGRPARRALASVAELAGLVLFCLLAWQLWLEAARTAGYGTTAGVLRLPVAPFVFAAAGLAALTAGAHALMLVRGLTGRVMV